MISSRRTLRASEDRLGDPLCGVAMHRQRDVRVNLAGHVGAGVVGRSETILMLTPFGQREGRTRVAET